MYPWLCVSLLVPYSLGNHAQLRGGSVAERLRSTLAYGWVEHCSDVAGCGMNYSQDKYSCLFHICNYIYYLMDYDEHAKFLNVWFCFRCMVTMYACFTSKHFSFYVCMFMGIVSRIDNGMVASSSLVGG